jgi:hypothetical protein
MNYVGVRQGEWRWWWVLISLFFIVVLIGILFPVYDSVKRRRVYGPHRSQLLAPKQYDKQHNKALHPPSYAPVVPLAATGELRRSAVACLRPLSASGSFDGQNHRFVGRKLFTALLRGFSAHD